LDTKLKKTHKLTNLIITFCVLMPAILLVALYPKIGAAMKEKKEEYAEKIENSDYEDYILDETFVNYAMESSYILYANILAEQGENIDVVFYETYGWMNDYGVLKEDVRFKAVYDNGTEVIKTNGDTLENEATVCYLTVKFDSAGFLSDTTISGEVETELTSASSLFEQANKSVAQFRNNVAAYEEAKKIQMDEEQYMPKNFEVTFAVDSNSTFLYSDDYVHHVNNNYDESLLFETGGLFLICVFVCFVALAAICLPFIKKLETGYEKLFRIPFEFIGVIGTGCGFGMFFMYFVMAYTCGRAQLSSPEIQLLGYKFTGETWYGILLVFNLLAWALLFLAEYIVITSLRQLIANPKKYLSERILIVRFLKYAYKKISSVQLNKKLTKVVIFISCIFGSLIFCVCLICQIYIQGWFDSYWLPTHLLIACLMSVGFGMFVNWIGKKIQKHYVGVLDATSRIADGDLKFKIEKDYGMFTPIAKELERVQEGFGTAVMEEAKSQRMKSELITNVSHDLKTPLTAIITYIDLLKQEDISPEEQKIYIATLEQKSQRLKILIEDLFEVSKVQSGNVKMNFAEIDIVSLMKQVYTEMEDQIEASELSFRFHLPEKKIMLMLDGQRTYRVFENLLNNTLKYSLKYSRVYVDIIENEQDVRVMIRNTSAEEIAYSAENLTERFVRGDASRKTEGSGLGLAIAKSFVELQNGKFVIETDGDLFKVIIIWTK